MTKPTLTLNFDSLDELQAFVSRMAPANRTAPASTGSAGPAAGSGSPLPVSAAAAATGSSASLAGAGQGGTAATASPSDAVTEKDVREAYMAYVQKGEGRTAATGRALVDRFGGAPALKDVSPDKFPVLKAEFERRTSGPDADA